MPLDRGGSNFAGNFGMGKLYLINLPLGLAFGYCISQALQQHSDLYGYLALLSFAAIGLVIYWTIVSGRKAFKRLMTKLKLQGGPFNGQIKEAAVAGKPMDNINLIYVKYGEPWAANYAFIQEEGEVLHYEYVESHKLKRVET